MLAWLCAVLLITPVSQLEQQEQGTIAGKVIDAANQPVSKAVVMVCDQATGIPLHAVTYQPFTDLMAPKRDQREIFKFLYALTDDRGCFSLPPLPPGEYRLVSQSFDELDPEKGLIEAKGHVVTLHGAVDRIKVPSKDSKNVVIRPLGNCRIYMDKNGGDLFLVVSMAPTCADPILGPLGWQADFLRKAIGWNRLPKGRVTFQGVPYGTIHVAACANDNNPGFGVCVIETDPSTPKLIEFPIVASWSNAHHDPPERLVPLYEKFKDKPELLASLLGSQDPGAMRQSTIGWGRPEELAVIINLPDGEKATVADLRAVYGYIQLHKELERRARERAHSREVLAEAEIAGRIKAENWGTLAWQQTDSYIPPDFEAFFPDDPKGGELLDVLSSSLKRDDRPPDEILEIVRRGLRRTTKYRTLILGTIGNRFIWGKSPQHPKAIEIMYHAAEPSDQYGTRHYAVYFGLSVVEPPKPPAVLRALVEICMVSRDVGRTTWGCRSELERLRPFLEPFLKNEDSEIRETAVALDKHFKGELDFNEWKRDRNASGKK